MCSSNLNRLVSFFHVAPNEKAVRSELYHCKGANPVSLLLHFFYQCST
jgi:hypothetical protein